MSRAFVKEIDGQDPQTQLPEIPISTHPNWVTPYGYQQLQQRRAAVQAERSALEASDDPLHALTKQQLDRTLRYLNTRLQTAQICPPPADGTHIQLGAIVEFEDASGARYCFQIVGEDEADIEQAKISWVSPLACALRHLQVGDEALWKRPMGDLQVWITAVGYPNTDAP